MMKIVIIFCFCRIYAAYAEWGGHSSLHQDFSSIHDRKLLDQLSRELLHTMELQERQLLPLKEKYVKIMAYQVGLVIGLIREKYKRLMDMYSEMYRRRTGRTKVTGNGVWNLEPFHFLITVNEMKMLELDCGKYVDLLLKIPDRELDEDTDAMGLPPGMGGGGLPPGAIPPPPFGGNSGKLSRLRIREENNLPNSTLMPMPGTSGKIVEPQESRLTEQDIKDQYRKSYMKEHGQQQDEWSLDHFYGFN